MGTDNDDRTPPAEVDHSRRKFLKGVGSVTAATAGAAPAGAPAAAPAGGGGTQ